MNKPTLIFAAALSAASFAFADNGAWTGPSGGLWSATSNWSSGVVADGSGFTADFSTLDITADTTVLMDAAHTLSGLKFGDTSTATAGSWILSNNGNAANILTLDGSAAVTVGTLGTARTATISAVVAGSAGLLADGAGVLVLSGNNTYTGSTWVKGAAGSSTGTIQFSSAANLGADTSAIRIGQSGSSSGVLKYTGAGETFSRGVDINGNATLDASGSGNWNIAGNVSVSGGNGQGLTLSGSGAGTIANLTQNASLASSLTKTGSGSWTVTGANTFTGAITINGSGTVGVSGTSFLQLAALGNGGNITFGVAGLSAGQLNYTGAGESTNRLLALNGHGTLVNNGTGALNFTNTGAILHTSTGNHTLTLAGSNTDANTIATSLVNGSATTVISKTGAGTWILSGANSTYTGGTTVSAGKLVAASASALGAGNVSVAAAGTLQIGDGVSNAVTLGSAATLSTATGATLKLGSAASQLTMTGAFSLAADTKIDITGLNLASGSYTLIAGSSGASTLGSWNAATDLVGGVSGSTYTLALSGTNLVLTAVPEPSVYGALGAGSLALVAAVRRRRRA